MTKGNPTPADFVALCSAANTRDLIKLNIHLRSHGIDARYVSASKVGAVIMVPPDQHERAEALRDAWLKEPTKLEDDWERLTGLEGEAA